MMSTSTFQQSKIIQLSLVRFQLLYRNRLVNVIIFISNFNVTANILYIVSSSELKRIPKEWSFMSINVMSHLKISALRDVLVQTVLVFMCISHWKDGKYLRFKARCDKPSCGMRKLSMIFAFGIQPLAFSAVLLSFFTGFAQNSK